MTNNVLITGGSGLLAVNWAVAVRDRYSVMLGLHRRRVSLPSVQSTTLDLDSVDRLAKQIESFKADIVVHATGLTSVEKCETDPELAWRTNVTTAENIASACYKLGISLVHVSTDHLFSGECSMADELERPTPLNVYAQTKAIAENKVLENHPSALVVRTNFYGWGTSYRQSFSDIILQALRQQRPISLFSDVFYTPILVSALAEIVHQLVVRRANGIFNVTGSERLSKYHFGLNVAKVFDLNPDLIRSIKLRDMPRLVRRPEDMSLSNKKVCAFLGRDLGNVVDYLEELKRQEQVGLAQELGKL
jgi:dTDP-4-dehydrorhamnose reductase